MCLKPPLFRNATVTCPCGMCLACRSLTNTLTKDSYGLATKSLNFSVATEEMGSSRGMATSSGGAGARLWEEATAWGRSVRHPRGPSHSLGISGEGAISALQELGTGGQAQIHKPVTQARDQWDKSI